MKTRNSIYVLLIFVAYQSKAQEDDFRKVITKTFYDERIHDKLFFEYEFKGINFHGGLQKGNERSFYVA